jgi:hypothetical protein
MHMNKIVCTRAGKRAGAAHWIGRVGADVGGLGGSQCPAPSTHLIHTLYEMSEAQQGALVHPRYYLGTRRLPAPQTYSEGQR